MYASQARPPASPQWLYGVTFCVWGLLCYSLVFWGFKWLAQAQTEVSVVGVGHPLGDLPLPTPQSLQAALGETAGPQTAPLSAQEALAQQTSVLQSRLRLLGVVGVVSSQGSTSGAFAKHRQQSSGVALLSLDQQAAKPFKAGDEVEAGLYVLTLDPKGVTLGPTREGPETLRLEMPALKGL